VAALFFLGRDKTGSMDTSSHLDDPQYWLDRAEEIRALAEGMTDEQKRGSLLEIVRDYQDLVQRALQRLAAKQPPKND
jgi:hypothetical protein